RAESCARSPATTSILQRDLLPWATSMVLFGTSSQSANARTNALFASPFSGTARTCTLNAGPSAVFSTPSTPSRDDFGVRRTRTFKPLLVAVQGAVVAAL